MSTGKTEKIDRGLKKLRKDFGRVGKVRRWLATTNDFRGAPEWVKSLGKDTALELIRAMGRLNSALCQMEMLKEWMEKKNEELK